MVCHASDFDGQPANALDDAADVGEDAAEVFRPHLHARALDVEYQMNVDFYQCTCHICLRGHPPCLSSVTPSGLLLGCSFFCAGVPLRSTACLWSVVPSGHCFAAPPLVLSSLRPFASGLHLSRLRCRGCSVPAGNFARWGRIGLASTVRRSDRWCRVQSSYLTYLYGVRR